MLVHRQAPFLYPVFYPPKASNRVIFARILRTSSFLLTAAILKGCLLLRMRRGVGCCQPKRRLPPAATSNRLQHVTAQLAECSPSMLLPFKGKIVFITKRPINTCCVYFTHNLIRTCCIAYFNSICMELFFCIACAYLGRQNELTFVGAIS